MIIKKITAIEILDSRGRPTVSAKVELENGISAKAMVPSGASTGKYEAKELRDGDKDRFNGLGVLQAIKNIEEVIHPKLKGFDVTKQKEIDDIMIKLDGTEDKSNLGANAILAVSLACARTAALALDIPLYNYLIKFNPNFSGKYIMPRPMMNVLNGGAHANWSSDIQEYMIIPAKAKSVSQSIKIGAEIYLSLKNILKEKEYGVLLGDEGGFSPATKNNEEPFTLLKEATTKAGYVFGEDIVLAIDAAASEFYESGVYNLKKEGKLMKSEELLSFYQNLAEKYPIYSFEDVFAEDDWDPFINFTANNINKQVVGDDLYVTNYKRLKKGIKNKATNSILIKLNQIGTLSETIDTILLASENGFSSVISHRSGETEDTFIADLAVAMGTGQIKTGALARSERTAKYNRLLEIEHELEGQSILTELPFLDKE